MSTRTEVRTATVPTPVGDLVVAATGPAGGDGDDERLVAVAFADHFERVAAPVRRRLHDHLWTEGDSVAAEAVRRYVAGALDALDDVAVESVGTPFQQQVWAALRTIPVGTTCSYAEVARAVGAPRAVRAVGAANGANPVWVAVPCHRVVRSDGSLGGYGGGTERKAWLLSHEASDGNRPGLPS